MIDDKGNTKWTRVYVPMNNEVATMEGLLARVSGKVENTTSKQITMIHATNAGNKRVNCHYFRIATHSVQNDDLSTFAIYVHQSASYT